MRHTKIVATVGPASDADATLDALIASGVDVFRLNFSHGTHEGHRHACDRIRAAGRRAGRLVGIMQDLSGPKIRTGRLAGGEPLALGRGDELRIALGDFVGGPGRVSTTYAGLVRSVRPGDRLLLDDGRLELRVESVAGDEIAARVVDEGTLGEHKGINAPGVAMPASALTAKDVEDLTFGVELGVDLIAVSFVQTAADLVRAREAVLAAGGSRDLPLVAKIERPEAVKHLDDILRAANAVMVARGDLGLELPLEHVPRVQKDITLKARAAGVPVIVATQVLESMRTESRPTRAEVSDAANAVADGVDAIMLAGETAIGQYPVRAVQTLDRIIRAAESSPPLPVAIAALAGEPEHGRALCEAAVTLATRGQADALVAVTRGGKTARQLAAFRPGAPILAVTDRPVTAAALTIFWGVVPHLVEPADAGAGGAAIGDELVRRGALAAGAVAVFINVSPQVGGEGGNFLKLQRLDARA